MTIDKKILPLTCLAWAVAQVGYVSAQFTLPELDVEQIKLTKISKQRKSTHRWAVGVLQTLLNEANSQARTIDGLWGENTTAEFEKYCRTHYQGKLKTLVDKKVWKQLLLNSKRYLLHVRCDTAKLNQVFESTFTLYSLKGAAPTKVAEFHGSIRAQRDRIKSHGRIADGVYELELGFHNREGGKNDATKSDLTPKLRPAKLRPCLVVARDGKVQAVNLDGTNLKTSDYIHIHDSPKNSRSSLGCQTLPPKEWKRFIGILIDAYPDFSSWQSSPKSYRGQTIGVMLVETVNAEE